MTSRNRALANLIDIIQADGLEAEDWSLTRDFADFEAAWDIARMELDAGYLTEADVEDIADLMVEITPVPVEAHSHEGLMDYLHTLQGAEEAA